MIARKPGISLMDSAMGTKLIAQGLEHTHDDPCLWNCTHPDSVLAAHRADLTAGSQLITTNTFGANRAWLAKFANRLDARSINRAAVQLAIQARSSINPAAQIAGSIGPTCLVDQQIFDEQAQCLIDSGVGLLLLETIHHQQLPDLIERLRNTKFSCPVWVTLWEWGPNPAAIARQLCDLGITRWGVNCSANRQSILATFEHLAQAQLPASILKPSLTASDLTALINATAPLGLEFVGGCCGTTSADIHAIHQFLINYV